MRACTSEMRCGGITRSVDTHGPRPCRYFSTCARTACVHVCRLEA
jgi:hypothetical protein